MAAASGSLVVVVDHVIAKMFGQCAHVPSTNVANLASNTHYLPSRQFDNEIDHYNRQAVQQIALSQPL